MRIIPNSYGTEVHEFNPCHSPKDGKFCSKTDATGPYPGQDDKEAWQRYFDVERAWERKMTLAVSLGKISPEDAYTLGWRADSNAEKGYEPLPPTLYHVSTGFNEILRTGLKTRAEIGGVHRGLGGGTDDTISFTEDLSTARSIRAALLEGRRVARGELAPQQMWRCALAQPSLAAANTPRARYMQSQGPINAAEMLVSLYGKKGWKRGDPLPDSLDQVLRGVIVEAPGDSYTKDPALKAAQARTKAEGLSGLGAIPVRLVPAGYKVVTKHRGRDEDFAGYIERPMSPDERLDSAWEMYKRYASAREYAGGRMDPMFFLTDREALAKVKVKDIKILKFTPRPKARGYRVSSLGEWRAHTGKAVRYAGIAEAGVW